MNVLYYFSGTGNTLKVAKDLASELGDTELIKITPDLDMQKQIEAKRVGIIYPVYCWGLPLIVSDFIKKAKISKDSYVFGVATYGAMLAYSGKTLKHLIEDKGLKLSAGFAINMPGNAQTVYDVVKQEKQLKMFKKEQVRIKEIAQIISAKQKYKVETNLGIFGLLLTKLAYPGMIKKINDNDKDFWVDDNCNGCEICAQVCPVKNVEIKDNKPTWKNKCQACLACMQWCPKQAIQHGKKSAFRKRYHHPEISVSEIKQ